jgi:hypothetical protein
MLKVTTWNKWISGSQPIVDWFGSHFSTRNPSFFFEPYLDRYSAKRNQPMKITKLIPAITVSAGLMLGPAVLAQEETPVDMKDVPSPAQTTIKEKAGNDQIVRVAKETRKGKECYDAVVNKNGKEMAIRVDSNGKFLGTHPEKSEKKAKSGQY